MTRRPLIGVMEVFDSRMAESGAARMVQLFVARMAVSCPSAHSLRSDGSTISLPVHGNPLADSRGGMTVARDSQRAPGWSAICPDTVRSW